MTNGSDLHSSLKVGWTSFSLGVAVLFSLPLLVVLFYRGDFLPIANESLAYRFFACERIRGGEGGTVWLPQGYVTSAIQELVIAAIDTAGKGRLSLRARLGLFSVGSLAVNALMLALVMILAGRSDALPWCDKLLIGVVALVPLYGTRTAGFYYSLLPDYMHLDMVLVTTGVWVFLVQWRGRWNGNVWSRVAILGTFQGLLVANKVTLATLGVIVILPALLSGPKLFRTIVAKLVLWLCCSSLTVLLVMLAFYLFRVSAMLEMLPRYLQFMLTAGAEPNFWLQKNLFLVTYGYAYFVGFWAASCVFAGVVVWTQGQSAMVSRVVVIGVTCSGLAQLYTVYRRSAGSTAFEASTLLLAFGVIALTVTPATRITRVIVVGTASALTTLSVSTFPLAENLQVVRESAARAQRLWDIHSEVLRIAAGRPIVVVLPDNSFHHEGVDELLLKGAADFPTWNISSRGQWIIDRYAPGMTFRHEYNGGTSPGAKIAADAVVLWFDKPHLPPLMERYSRLAVATRRPGSVTRSWNIAQFDGQSQFDGSIQMVARLSFVP